MPLGTGLDDTVALNNQSLVVRFDYKGFSALFTGDLYEEGEENLVESVGERLNADILKIPHHGSPSSGSARFLAAVTPKLAVATGYQEMSQKQISSYGSARVLTDRMNGYIHVAADGSAMEYETEQTRRRGEPKAINPR